MLNKIIQFPRSGHAPEGTRNAKRDNLKEDLIGMICTSNTNPRTTHLATLTSS